MRQCCCLNPILINSERRAIVSTNNMMPCVHRNIRITFDKCCRIHTPSHTIGHVTRILHAQTYPKSVAIPFVDERHLSIGATRPEPSLRLTHPKGNRHLIGQFLNFLWIARSQMIRARSC